MIPGAVWTDCLEESEFQVQWETRSQKIESSKEDIQHQFLISLFMNPNMYTHVDM